MGKRGGGAATKQTASKNGRLSKDELLARLKRRESELDLGDGGTILVQGLTLDDFAAIRTMSDEEDEAPDVAELFKKVCLLGCVDPSFTIEDLDTLGDADLAMVTTIANEIMSLSGMLGSTSVSAFLTDIRTSRESSSSVSGSSDDSRAS